MRRGLLEPEARLLIESKAVRGVQIVPAGGRWAVVLLIGLQERPIASKREDVRTWASLDTVAGWLKGLGLAEASLRVV